jgi:hypothetical protein
MAAKVPKNKKKVNPKFNQSFQSQSSLSKCTEADEEQANKQTKKLVLLFSTKTDIYFY